MKPGIHPPFYEKAKTTCTACGAVFLIPNTVKEQQVEICSNCHPVYTGKFRGLMTSGRVERFRKKLAVAKTAPKKAPKRVKLSPEEKLEKRLEVKRAEKAEKKSVKKTKGKK